MLVFWKQKIVLLAVPKTGTTALEQALLPFASSAILNPPGQKHISATGYRNRLASFFEARGRHPMQLVAVMREPVEWLGSWYRYRTRPQLAGKANSTAEMSFDHFVQAWLEPERPSFAAVGSQLKFLTDEDGSRNVDHIFRYDRMAQLVTFFEDHLGRRIELPQANVSPQRELSLSAQTKARLQTEAVKEFELWESL